EVDSRCRLGEVTLSMRGLARLRGRVSNDLDGRLRRRARCALVVRIYRHGACFGRDAPRTVSQWRRFRRGDLSRKPRHRKHKDDQTDTGKPHTLHSHTAPLQRYDSSVSSNITASTAGTSSPSYFLFSVKSVSSVGSFSFFLIRAIRGLTSFSSLCAHL